MNDRARRAAELIWSAWTSGTLISALPADVRPRDAAEGFAVQQSLADLAGPAYGWKIAATSVAAQSHVGVDGPLPGRLFDCFRHAEGARLPSHDLHMRVVEAEFAFVMAGDLDGDAPLDRATVLTAVGALHLAIEVPDSRFDAFEIAGAPQLLADDAFAGRFVLGPEVPGWDELDLAAWPTALHVNGVTAATGRGGNVLGDPREALRWLAVELRRFGAALRAGDVVTTGTTTVPPSIGPGDDVLADFGELGTVRVGVAQ